MATVPYPKSWTSGEVLTEADLNAQFAAVNSISGIAGSALLAATITEAQMAAASVSTPQLVAASVTISKMADRASVSGFFNAAAASVTPIGTNTTLVSQNITLTRSTVRIVASFLGSLSPNAANPNSITVELLRDATVLASSTNMLVNVAAGFQTIPISGVLPFMYTNVTAGAHTYLLRMTVSGGGQTTVVDAHMMIEEVA